MNGIYDNKNENASSVIVTNKRFACPMHFHRNAEVFLLNEGVYIAIIENKEVVLKAGDICFFDSYNAHAFLKGMSNVKARLLTIPYNLLDEYNVVKADRKLAGNIISDKELCNSLIDIVDRFIKNGKSENVKQVATKLILALISEKLVFTGKKDKNETELIRKILVYISAHFKEKISLALLSRHFGYTEEHISREFHRYLSVGISEYINWLRYNYIECEIKKGRKGLGEIVFEGGFGSLQTYYRFKAKMKTSSLNYHELSEISEKNMEKLIKNNLKTKN